MLAPDEPHHTIYAVLELLPPFERSLVREHFIDGDNLLKLMRRHRMKRRDVVARLETALMMMRAALWSRGVRGVADVL